MDLVSRLAWLLAIPSLAGCFLFRGGETSRVEPVPEELRQPRLVPPPVPDRHLYGDVMRLQVGLWAAYREGDRTVTIAAVGKGAEGVWIEVVEEGEPRLASARLVSPEGVVRKAFYCEVSRDGRSAVVDQPLEQWSPPVGSGLVEVGRETSEETVRVGDRDLRARAVRVRFEDLEGRSVEEATLWHPDVPPVYAWSEGGGLVLRKAGGLLVELRAFGSDARPLVGPLP
jgi:hypothetical protein